MPAPNLQRVRTALGPPDPAAAREALEDRPARPSSQTGAPGGSGPRRAPAGDRRGADLGAGADGSAPARMSPTIQPAAVRVRGDGGGGPRGRCGNRPGSRCLRCRGAEGCLAQRRELECRADGLSHPLGERACEWPACRQRGEHVFVKVGRGSDGTSDGRASTDGDLALPRGKGGRILQAVLHGRRRGETAAAGRSVRAPRRPARARGMRPVGERLCARDAARGGVRRGRGFPRRESGASSRGHRAFTPGRPRAVRHGKLPPHPLRREGVPPCSSGASRPSRSPSPPRACPPRRPPQTRRPR